MVLILLTGADPKLVKELTADMEAEVIDMARKDVDYGQVLERIFEAESVQVW